MVRSDYRVCVGINYSLLPGDCSPKTNPLKIKDLARMARCLLIRKYDAIRPVATMGERPERVRRWAGLGEAKKEARDLDAAEETGAGVQNGLGGTK